MDAVQPQVQFAIVPLWIIKTLDPQAVRLYALLAGEYSNGNVAFPSHQTMAENLNIGEKTARRALESLVKAGAIVKTARKRANGSQTSNMYTLMHFDPLVIPDHPPWSPVTTPEPEKTSNQKDLVQIEVAEVGAAWKLHGTIRHRDSYFDRQVIRTAIVRAISGYDVKTVCDAIMLYGFIVRSPDYYWTHKWTLADFLKRGLDKFVPEADPMGNFKTKAMNGKLTPTEIATYFDKEPHGSAERSQVGGQHRSDVPQLEAHN